MFLDDGVVIGMATRRACKFANCEDASSYVRIVRTAILQWLNQPDVCDYTLKRIGNQIVLTVKQNTTIRSGKMRVNAIENHNVGIYRSPLEESTIEVAGCRLILTIGKPGVCTLEMNEAEQHLCQHFWKVAG